MEDVGRKSLLFQKAEYPQSVTKSFYQTIWNEGILVKKADW